MQGDGDDRDDRKVYVLGPLSESQHWGHIYNCSADWDSVTFVCKDLCLWQLTSL